MTVFAKIISGELPAEKVFEDQNLVVIKDIHPAAPVHLLIIPKKPIQKLHDIAEEDLPLMSQIVKVAKKLAQEFGIEEGYRLVVNNGSKAGQTVFHLHFHLLGGKELGSMG